MLKRKNAFAGSNSFFHVSWSQKCKSAQLLFPSQTEYARFENGRFVYRINRSPMCEYMINFIHKLKHLPEKYMMNSVLENFTILLVTVLPLSSWGRPSWWGKTARWPGQGRWPGCWSITIWIHSIQGKHGLRSIEETGFHWAGLSFSKLGKTRIQMGSKNYGPYILNSSCTLERCGELLKYLKTCKSLTPRLRPRSVKSGSLRIEPRHEYFL